MQKITWRNYGFIPTLPQNGSVHAISLCYMQALPRFAFQKILAAFCTRCSCHFW